MWKITINPYSHHYLVQLERPAVNESDAVVLTFGLTLQQIIDVVNSIITIIIIVIITVIIIITIIYSYHPTTVLLANSMQFGFDQIPSLLRVTTFTPILWKPGLAPS